MRLDGLVEEVDGAQLVSLELPVPVAHSGGDEDDGGRAACAPAPRISFRQLEAVHHRHLHVDQGREATSWTRSRFERLRTGARLQELHVLPPKQGGEREEVSPPRRRPGRHLTRSSNHEPTFLEDAAGGGELP